MSQIISTPTGTWSIVDLTHEEMSMIGASLEESQMIVMCGPPDVQDPEMLAIIAGLLEPLRAWRFGHG